MHEMLVGNAPVSWGVYEADDDNPPFGDILDAISAAGYAGTELGPYGFLPTEASALASALSERELRLGSSFVALPLEDAAQREASVAHALDVARLLATQDVRWLILADDEDPARARDAGRIATDGSQGWSDAEWSEAGKTLDAVGRALHDELGMRAVVHHHAGTFIETPDEIDRMLTLTDPERVGLLLDTGHCLYGGGDPLDVYRRHAQRTWYVHLKDADTDKLARVRDTNITMQDAWRGGIFCPLGAGAADFGALAEALRTEAYKGWLVVEQDVVPDADGRLDPDPLVAAQHSRAFLRDELGV
jgi:inosose dehydratase